MEKDRETAAPLGQQRNQLLQEGGPAFDDGFQLNSVLSDGFPRIRIR